MRDSIPTPISKPKTKSGLLPPQFDATGKKICGAHSRQSGLPCKRHPTIGKDRCRMHGGASVKGLVNAEKSGIYTKELTDDEFEDYTNMRRGSVDDEIRCGCLRGNIETEHALYTAQNNSSSQFKITQLKAFINSIS
ncbi:MAG: hypothetical protein JZU60_03085 [Ilumatobacteraceae bacterium]|jgi:hypothetical protein|nr:hypothetical protein [Ilumatobacteraceae bacterium]